VKNNSAESVKNLKELTTFLSFSYLGKQKKWVYQILHVILRNTACNGFCHGEKSDIKSYAYCNSNFVVLADPVKLEKFFCNILAIVKACFYCPK